MSLSEECVAVGVVGAGEAEAVRQKRSRALRLEAAEEPLVLWATAL